MEIFCRFLSEEFLVKATEVSLNISLYANISKWFSVRATTGFVVNEESAEKYEIWNSNFMASSLESIPTRVAFWAVLGAQFDGFEYHKDEWRVENNFFSRMVSMYCRLICARRHNELSLMSSGDDLSTAPERLQSPQGSCWTTFRDTPAIHLSQFVLFCLPSTNMLRLVDCLRVVLECIANQTYSAHFGSSWTREPLRAEKWRWNVSAWTRVRIEIGLGIVCRFSRLQIRIRVMKTFVLKLESELES